MTTLGNENLCDDAVATKKRAQAIKSRLEEMGHKAPLSHAYEILATSCGYRNWPTMKANVGKKVENARGPYIFGRVQGSTNTKIIMRTEDPDLKWVGVGPATPDLFDKATYDEITALIAGKISDEGSWGAMWKGRVVGFLTGIIWALVCLRDQKGSALNVETIRRHLSLDHYVKFAWGTIKSDVPDQLRRLIASYMNGAGYVDAPGRDQSDAVKEAHGYLEALISDALCMIETDLKWHAFKVKRSAVG